MAGLTSLGQAWTKVGQGQFIRTDTDTPKGECPDVRSLGKLDWVVAPAVSATLAHARR